MRNASENHRITAKNTFKTFKLFGENIAALSCHQTKIYWNKPTIIGATILDLSKRGMFLIHNNTMRAHVDCRLLYSDTDSLVYKVVSQNFYKKLAELPHKAKDQISYIEVQGRNWWTNCGRVLRTRAQTLICNVTR